MQVDNLLESLVSLRRAASGLEPVGRSLRSQALATRNHLRSPDVVPHAVGTVSAETGELRISAFCLLICQLNQIPNIAFSYQLFRFVGIGLQVLQQVSNQRVKQRSQKYRTVPMSSPSLVEGEEWLLQLLRPPNPTLSRSQIQSRVWQMILIQEQSQSQTLLHDQQRGPKRGPRSPLHGEVVF